MQCVRLRSVFEFGRIEFSHDRHSYAGGWSRPGVGVSGAVRAVSELGVSAPNRRLVGHPIPEGAILRVDGGGVRLLF